MRKKPGDSQANWLARATPLRSRLTPGFPVDGDVERHPHPSPVEIHIHRPMEVGVVLEGRHERLYQGLVLTLEPGEVWLDGMWEPHGWRALAPNTAEVVVSFLPEFLGEETLGEIPWLALFAASHRQRPRLLSDHSRAEGLRLGKVLASELAERTTAWRTAVRLCLLELLLLLHRHWRERPARSPAPDHGTSLSRVMPAVDLLHERPGFAVSAAEAAAICALSRSQFYRAFARATGMGFSQFRLRARLAFAEQRLLTTHAPIEAIAEQAGFTDASHLCRAFLRRYRCTPSAYRRHSGRPPK